MTVTNDYYEATEVTRATLARAEAITEDRLAVQAAFDKLPAPATLQNLLGAFFTAGGTANALTGTLTPTLTAYSDGLPFTIRTPLANTSSTVTLNIDGLGARALKLPSGGNPPVGALVAGGLVQVVYDASTSTFVLTGAGSLPTVQTSTTDTTAGALLAMGAFGLGSTSVPEVTGANALDNLSASGAYRVAEANVSSVNGPSGAVEGVVDFVAFSTGYGRQTYYEVDTPGRIWTRYERFGLWSLWFPVSMIDTTGALNATGSIGSGGTGTFRAYRDTGTGLLHVYARGVVITAAGYGEAWTASIGVSFSAGPVIIATINSSGAAALMPKITTASTTDWAFNVVDDTDTNVGGIIHFHAVGPY